MREVVWVLVNEENGGRWPLASGSFVIGRAPDCQILLDDPMVSRHHASMSIEDDAVVVRDLGSSNGVFVNGHKVVEARLAAGDELALGPLRFRVMREGAEAGVPVEGTIVERGSLSAIPSLDSTRLQVLYGVVEAIVGNLSLEDMLHGVLDTLEGLFSYDRCTLAVKDEGGGLVVWASRPRGVQVPYSKSIVNRVLSKGEAILFDDVQGEAPFDLGESVTGLNIRSVLCAPLDFRGEIRGLVYLDRSVSGAYSVDDLALLRSVSHVVAIALENARLYSELQERYAQKAGELKEAQRRLVQSERTAALGQLARAMAHHMRNPIMVIGGMARRVRRALEKGEGVRPSELEAVLSQARRLERMMKTVDELIRLPEPRPMLVPLEATVEEVVRRHEGLRGRRPWIRSGLNRRAVPHDPVLVGKALAAVLGNAIEKMPPGGELAILVDECPGGWFVEVSDRKAPYPEAGYKAIFDPYFQAHPWGLDLALTLAQKAMADQGGELLAAADQAGGTSIRLLVRRPGGLE